MFDSFKNAYQSFSNSVDGFQRDMADIRDTFVGIKNVIGAIFNFMGQETAILLFCTFLFLFVVNLIPFLFVGKKRVITSVSDSGCIWGIFSITRCFRRSNSF